MNRRTCRIAFLALTTSAVVAVLSGCTTTGRVQSPIQASLPTPSATVAQYVPAWADPGPDPRLKVQVATEPATPRAGESLILRVRIGNLTDVNIPGVYVDLSGDWTTTTLVGVRPNGKFRHDPSGRYIVSELFIPPGEDRQLDIETLPGKSGGTHLVFWVRALSSFELLQLL